MLTVVVRRQNQPTFLLLYPWNVPIVVREFYQMFVVSVANKKNKIQDRTRQCIFHFHRKKSVSFWFFFFLYFFATLEIIQTKSIESICTMSIQFLQMDFQKTESKRKKKLMRNEWICIFEVNPNHIRNANGWYVVKWFVLTLTWPLT